MAYRTLNPFTEQTVREFVQHTDAEVEAFLARADALFHSPWSKGEIGPRLAVLEKLATLLADNRETLARVIAEEMGKPVFQGRMEVDLCADIAKYYATKSRELLKPERVESPLGEAWVEFHPIGVLLAVEPWNFPIYQLTRAVVPAIAVGNPIMFKHASIVPQCAAFFEKLVRQAGAPDGAVTNLYVSASKISELLGDDRVQGVALTGSEGAGSKVGARASEMLKKSTLELGGSDVFIVLDDADIENAVKTAVMGRLINAGQMCTASKRFIVQRSIADTFINAFVAGMKSAVLGDPMSPDTLVGPLSSRDALEDLTRQVNAAVSHGATVLTGGKRADRKGFFYEPTVLTGVTRDNPAYYQEFFGPVAQIFVVDSDDAAVAQANDSHYGLGATIFSRDTNRSRGLASRVESGMVYINTLGLSRPELPFGGVKRSGYGRELGEMGLKEFVNRKLVVVGAG